MSRIFTLASTKSEFSENYYPPIVLQSDKQYGLGLIGFSSYNSIPNIDESNNVFVIESKTIHIPKGSYELDAIAEYIREQLDEGAVSVFKANNNTLKVEIKSKYNIDFSVPNSIGSLLGFSSRILESGKLHQSDLPVDIIKVTSVRVECNLVSSAYYGDKLQHTLFEFTPNVDPGYAIIIEPQNIIYLPIHTSIIDNISIRLLDQEGRVVNFQGEKIIIRFELKPL